MDGEFVEIIKHTFPEAFEKKSPERLQQEAYAKLAEYGLEWHDMTKVFTKWRDLEAFDDAFVYNADSTKQLEYLTRMVKKTNVEGLDVKSVESWRDAHPRLVGNALAVAKLEARKVFQ